MKDMAAKVQVNIPFRMLVSDYLDRFLDLGLNPEIGLDAESLDRFAPDDFKRAADRFRDLGRRITVHGPFMDLSPTSPDPAITAVTERRFDQMFEALGAIKPVTTVVHAGYDPRKHVFMRDLWLEKSLAFFQKASLRAAGLGTRLMLENVYEETPEDLLPLIDALDPETVGVCLDVGHLHALGTVGLDRWLAVLGRRIGQCHLHDNRGDRDSHLAMGEGTIDFDPLFRFIENRGPVLTLEPHEEKDLYTSLAYLQRFYR
ncbi:sugar phosphate isomerase/epimerase [Desulfatiferula olefinivorans]